MGLKCLIPWHSEDLADSYKSTVLFINDIYKLKLEEISFFYSVLRSWKGIINIFLSINRMDKNQVNIQDCLVIFLLALTTNIFAELLSFIFIYRQKKYKELTRMIENLNKKIEQTKLNLAGNVRTNERKIKKSEDELKVHNFEMMKVRHIIL